MAAGQHEKKRRQPQGQPAAEQTAKPEKPAKAAATTTNGEEDFPRGGADALTALERKQLAEAAKAEVEAEFAEGKQQKSKKPRTGKKGEDEEDAFFGRQAASLEGKMAKHVELLRVKTLSVGTKLWGMVLEVTPRGLVVSLPHGLRGHVAPSRASDILAAMLKAPLGGVASAAATPAAKKAAALVAAAGGAAPPLTDLFAVGQFVRCVVVEGPEVGDAGAAAGAGGRSAKHVELSLLLRDVQGQLGAGGLVEGAAVGACVRSVEDHGYTLSFGIKGTSGFLRRKDYVEQFGEGVALQVGGLLDVVVRSASDKRNVLVGCGPGDVAGAVTKEADAITGLDCLLPGALLNVKVRKILSNGLMVSFLTFFHGTVDSYHLPAASPAAAAAGATGAGLDWKKAYSEGAKLRARLLYVDPAGKRCGLSLLPHLMAMALPSPVPMLGSVFEEAEVMRVDPFAGPGLLLRLPGLPEGPAPAFCHVANALEDKVKPEEAASEMTKKFKAGAKLPARVIGYRLMDGMATVTVRPSQVSASVLSLADLAPGMLVSGTVTAVPDKDAAGGGVVAVQVAEGVRGIVPPLHASELAGSGSKGGRSAAKVKVKVGEKVEARVLEVDPASRRLTLTLRKALLAPKAAPLAALEAAVPGGRYSGLVTGFHDRLGVFVTFFGGVVGAAPASELGLEPGQAPQDLFSVGQVVKATVLGAAKGKLKLSLAPKAQAEAAAAAAATAAAAAPAAPAVAAAAAGGADALGGLQPGDVVAEATVVEVQASGEAAAAAAGGVAYVVRLDVPGGPAGGVRGKLEAAHLSDHPAAVEGFKEAIKPGSKLGRVLVLDRMEAQRCVRVTRKPSLLAAAAAAGSGSGGGALPKAFGEVAEGALLAGYVANVTGDAVYVRFLAGLTGRAGLPQLSDVFVSNPRELFSEGQSVRCQVATVDAARQRFTVLLRPSATASSDAAYLIDYFKEMAALQALRGEEGADGAAAAAAFPVGSLAGAAVHEVKDFGLVADLDGHPDVVGLVPSSHTGGAAPAVGARLKGRVLDVVAHQGLVELSLKPELVAAAKDTAASKDALKKLKAGTQVEAVVEGIRPGEYLILSLPAHAHLLAYAAVTDYNTPRPDTVPRKFTVGQRVTATVAATPASGAPAGRVLCHVPLTRAAASAAAKAAGGSAAAADGKKGAAAKVDLTPGTIVEAVVTGIQPQQLDVTIGKAAGRIHVTEVVDVDVKALLSAAAAAALDAVGSGTGAAGGPPAAKKARKSEPAAGAAAAAVAAKNPLDGFRLQQVVEAVVLGRLQGGEGHKRGVMDLSLRPSRVAIARKAEPQAPPVVLGDLVPGQQLTCFVLEVAEDALWLGAGPAVRGRCAALDASLDPNVCADLSAHFKPGAPVLARVLGVNAKKHTLDLTLVDPCSGKATHGSEPRGPGAGAQAPLPAEGALVMGRILSASGAGVRVSLGPKRAGRVALTDIHDTPVPNALASLAEGTYVRVRVLGKDGDFAVLSLRPSRGGAIAGATAAAAAGAAAGAAGKKGKEAGKDQQAGQAQPQQPELLDVGSVKVGDTVGGYVKRCDAKGVFVALDRYRDGRIKLGNLSDGFIEDPAAAFPPGSRLEARVVALEGDGRVELSLRSAPRSGSSGAAIQSLAELKQGQLVAGRVRRVEKFGVFVEVEGNSSVVGLAHISELADGAVKDISALFKPKQAVKAVVTKIDVAANRLSLSMKPSVLKEAEEAAGGSGAAAGGKRKRGADIDDEMADLADGSEGEDEEEDGSEEEGSEGEEGGSEEDEDGEDEGGPGSDVDVDDVDVSEEEEDDEADGDGDVAMADASDDQDDGEDEDEEEDEEEDEATKRSKPATTSTGALDLTTPWGELLLADDPRATATAAPAAADGDKAGGKGLSKAQKKRQKEQHEREIREAELARLSGSAAPQTPADFERLVLASPNSSFVWIKYMAHHIQLGDMDAARKVAQRALDSINYREEGEKFNVWVAWLNLENAFGTQPSPEEAAMGLLRRALSYTDQKKMYLAALGIFERSGKDELAEQVTKTMTKKFGGSTKVWVRALERTLVKDDGEGARKLLERATQSLPARKHIKLLTRAALAEFRLGSAERGRGILEGVLRNYPKRLDLWNVYIDQEIKTGEQARIRALFERATHLPLPPKKMKFLFRRFLEYEKEEGDAASVEHVKRRAMEFVESSLKA